tara:strand:- start:1474 stop:1755 length:282 start_codon:yes stop_codon:yes gene_type:complete
MSRPKIRKVKKGKKKLAKDAMSVLEQKAGLFLNIPSECCVCNEAFDKTDKEMINTWQVSVYEERKVVRLTCPVCHGKVANFLERLKNEQEQDD